MARAATKRAKTKTTKTTASKRTAAKKDGQTKMAAKTKGGGAAKAFKPGDKVAWDTSQGATQGRVVKKQTTPTKIKTHEVAASKENPQIHRRERQVGEARRAQAAGTAQTRLTRALRRHITRASRHCRGAMG